jgi:hypothetical protein
MGLVLICLRWGWIGRKDFLDKFGGLEAKPVGGLGDSVRDAEKLF